MATDHSPEPQPYVLLLTGVPGIGKTTVMRRLAARLAEESLGTLGPIAAICLTAACHQRSAWRYRKRFGAKVYAPARSRPMEEEPDLRYTAGQRLPGRLEAVHTPGPESAHYAFLRHGKTHVLFCADLLSRANGGALEFIPPALHDDPAATRKSVRRLLELDFSVLCLSHGAPITRDPQAALRSLLRGNGDSAR